MFENGLTWVKADFHLHTHKDKEFKYSGEENSFVKEYIAQLKSERNKFKSRVLALQKVRKPETMSTFQRCLGYSCAQVEGSDPKSISNVGHCDRATYLKIGDLSYDSVKFALTDFQNRVSGFMPQLKQGVIESISFTGGKLDGETIYVSPALNTLIGIRGSGKSSILVVCILKPYAKIKPLFYPFCMSNDILQGFH